MVFGDLPSIFVKISWNLICAADRLPCVFSQLYKFNKISSCSISISFCFENQVINLNIDKSIISINRSHSTPSANNKVIPI